MNKERRYKLYISNREYILDEEDLKKLKDNAGEMLVTLKQVIVHPPNVSDIAPFYVDYIPNTEMKDSTARIIGMKPPLPIEDLFSDKLLLN